ncbi:protein kinase [Paraliomyxa miuraensis]|uniref:protein kinase n=1 Tax=Paraliomyxa miuraensis TaxID=376150 RepID=UPI00225A1609|nr:protein kinase [Paraliomyxa miuraensis]MCX4245655.1 protein kinase [Paraliomyxa miuraensis]
MEILARGTPLDTEDILAPGARPGTPIVIERGLGECPHGFWYEARQEEVPLLVTVLDPILVAQPDVRAQLARDIERGRHVAHRNLLPCFGMGTAGVKALIAEAWPGGGTVREFARHRREYGQPIDLESAYILIAHVCNGLVALHEQLVHGYVTADTVQVSDEGRVLLGAVGLGSILPRSRGFRRFRAGGLLPNVPPEQVAVPPAMTMATDVFAVAALFVELITGNPLADAGQPLRDLDLHVSDELLACLERATDPDPDQRPPDIGELKAELAQALRAEGIQTTTRPPGNLDLGLGASMAAAHAEPEIEDNMDDWEMKSEVGPLPDPPPPPDHPGAPPPPEYGGPPAHPYADPMGAPGYPPPPGYPPYPPPPGYPPYPSPHGYPPEGGAGGYPYPPPGYPPYPPHGYPLYPPPGYPPYPPPGYPSYPPPPGYGPQPPPAEPQGGTPPPRPGADRGGFDPDAARRQMDELDRATRRIAGIDADSAVREYTEHVGDGDSRFDVDDDLEGDERSSSSMLNLEVDAYADAAQRLATLDGVEDTGTADSREPSESGPYFGSFSDDAEDEEPPEDDADSRFVVLRSSKEYGPYTVQSLSQMIRTGQIKSVDVVRSQTTGRESMVVDVPILRPACEDRRNREDIEARRPGGQAAAARPARPDAHKTPEPGDDAKSKSWWKRWRK